MGNTPGTHMGNIVIVCLSRRVERRQRIGRCAAEASEASRSGAAANALRASCAPLCATLWTRSSPLSLTGSNITCRTHPSGIRTSQVSNQKAAKIDRPSALALGLEPHRIPGESFPYEPPSPLPFDLSIGADPTHDPTLGIIHYRTAHRPWSGTIHLCRSSLPQSLVRANPIVHSHPAVGTPLLGSQMAGSPLCCLGLEHSVHLFVSPVLFRVPRGYEFDLNPQRCPPGAQTRKPCWTIGTKGPAIVAADHRRVTVLPKQTQKNPAHGLPTLVSEQTNPQEITTERISHGQRFHTLAVARTEPPLEIHGPDLIAPPGKAQSACLQLRPSRVTAALTTAQLHSLQPLANRPRGRHSLAWIFFSQARGQLPASPTAVSPPQTSDALQPLRRDPPWRAVGPAYPVSKTTRPLPLESRYPFVAALAAHSKTTAQLRHRLLGLQGQLYELQTPHHRREFFPRHARGKAPK